MLPVIREGIVDSETIITDGKTGVSGAGKTRRKKPVSQRYENMNTYREGHHQHIIEVENVINSISNTRKNSIHSANSSGQQGYPEYNICRH